MQGLGEYIKINSLMANNLSRPVILEDLATPCFSNWDYNDTAATARNKMTVMTLITF